MRKLSLLLLFAILVFQGCRKSYSTSEDKDLVPLGFSGTEITKAAPTDPITALVIGSKTSNDWSTIYTSVDESGISSSAQGTIVFGVGNVGNGNFDPVVYYPTNNDFIYIKALAQNGAEMDIANLSNNKVRFTITDGQQDIMATKQTSSTNPIHGAGNRRNENQQIKLEFEHVLSKVDFQITSRGSGTDTYWGKIKSVEFYQGRKVFDYDLTTHLTTEGTPGDLLGDFIVYKDDTWMKIPTSGNRESIGVSIMVCPTSEWQIRIVTENESSGRIFLSTLALVGGYHNTVSLTFEEGVTLGIASLSVKLWEDGVDGSGPIVIK